MKTLQFQVPCSQEHTLTIQEDNQPFFYPYLHQHQEMQITWIIRGEGTLVVDNQLHRFASGDIYLLGANQEHLFKSDPEYFVPGSSKSIQTLNIFFNPKGKLANLLQLPEMMALQPFIQQSQVGFKLPTEYRDLISREILNIQYATGIEQLIHFSLLLKRLYNMNESLEPLIRSSGSRLNPAEFEESRLKNVYNYVILHYSQVISLDDIADMANMSVHAFCRYFKKKTGQTFLEFLNQTRVNEACRKLASRKFDSISTIAYDCGFNSINNFNRVFKNLTSQSPRQYLSSYQANTN
ncbi:AraC family transcriptional regulator [Pedobacter sp. L105]|uniref:AraC family transcriptional regulator n=1 Tax=Pedobacter sp. L105 TaxID=1641871 RepID=UPI00131E50C0|nr:AraC family transcriptional regulator [Pedobacter sp. L105]